MDQEGNILIKLVGVDVPTKRNTGAADICSRCGELTIAGIYEMSDPTSLLFAKDGLGKINIPVVDHDFGYDDETAFREKD
jgi:hypothetical protein